MEANPIDCIHNIVRRRKHRRNDLRSFQIIDCFDRCARELFKHLLCDLGAGLSLGEDYNHLRPQFRKMARSDKAVPAVVPFSAKHHNVLLVNRETLLDKARGGRACVFHQLQIADSRPDGVLFQIAGLFRIQYLHLCTSPFYPDCSGHNRSIFAL